MLSIPPVPLTNDFPFSGTKQCNGGRSRRISIPPLLSFPLDGGGQLIAPSFNAPKVTKRFSRRRIVLDFALRPSDGCRRCRLRLCGGGGSGQLCAGRTRTEERTSQEAKLRGDGCKARRSWSSAEHEGKERNDLPPPPPSAYLLLPLSLSLSLHSLLLPRWS